MSKILFNFLIDSRLTEGAPPTGRVPQKPYILSVDELVHAERTFFHQFEESRIHGGFYTIEKPLKYQL